MIPFANNWIFLIVFAVHEKSEGGNGVLAYVAKDHWIQEATFAGVDFNLPHRFFFGANKFSQKLS